MKTTFEQEVNQARTLLDVLLILKKKTMLDTHVSTLAYLDHIVEPFNGKYGVWSCRPFPLDSDQKEYQIPAYYFSADGDAFSKDATVLIVFADRNFINGLKSPFATPTETADQLTHSLKYAIIVSLPGLGLTQSEEDAIMDF